MSGRHIDSETNPTPLPPATGGRRVLERLRQMGAVPERPQFDALNSVFAGFIRAENLGALIDAGTFGGGVHRPPAAAIHDRHPGRFTVEELKAARDALIEECSRVEGLAATLHERTGASWRNNPPALPWEPSDAKGAAPQALGALRLGWSRQLGDRLSEEKRYRHTALDALDDILAKRQRYFQ